MENTNLIRIIKKFTKNYTAKKKKKKKDIFSPNIYI